MIFARMIKEKFGILLWLIAGLALVLRVWGMWYGLPYLLHIDEQVFVNAGMRFGLGDFNPRWFGHPGNILMYLLFVGFLGFYGVGFVFGWFDSAQAFSEYFFADPTVFYLVGRSIGVFAGTLSVIATGHLGKRLVNERVGIIAAIFLAVDPLCVINAKFIRTDVLGTLFIILAIFWGVKYCDCSRRKYAILSSIAVGLAAANKYPYIVSGVITLLLVFFKWRKRTGHNPDRLSLSNFPWRFLLVNCAIILLSFFCVTPFFFFDFRTVLKDVSVEAYGHHLGAESLTLLRNFWWYFSEVLPRSTGLPIILGAVLGVFLILRNIDVRKLMIIVFPMFYFSGIIFVIGSFHLSATHWVIPILPFIGLYAAIAVDFLSSRLALFGNLKKINAVAIRMTALTILSLLFSIHSLKETISNNRELIMPDTRQACTEWIRKHIPEGKFAQEFYSFQPYSRYAYLIGEYEFEKYKIYQGFSITDRTLEEYRAAGFTHLILSSFIYDRYLDEPERYNREIQIYNSMFSMAPLHTFESIPGTIKGPRIIIYAIN
jgi:hypothetical protein